MTWPWTEDWLANPQDYEGDMRALHLQRQFNAVAIPDSIDYMATPDDLRQAVETASAHLKDGGVLLVTAKTKETFRNNNFAYVGENDGIHVTLLENNHVDPSRPDAYEAVIFYLTRQDGKLSMHTERHILGLFSRTAWQRIFRDAGFAMRGTPLDGVYDRYLLGDGTYPLTVFIGRIVDHAAGREKPIGKPHLIEAGLLCVRHGCDLRTLCRGQNLVRGRCPSSTRRAVHSGHC